MRSSGVNQPMRKKTGIKHSASAPPYFARHGLLSGNMESFVAIAAT